MQLASTVGLAAVVVTMASIRIADAQKVRDTGDGEIASKVSLYSDDDATTVVTSAVDAEVAGPADIDVGAHVLIDAVSTASIDVVSAATGRWTEDRVELGGRASIEAGRALGASLGYTHSQENDWQSHTIVGGVRRDLASRNTQLSANYALVLNRVGRRGDPSFDRSLGVHSLQLGIGQLWSSKTLLGLTYNLQRASGFQASPYRYASIDGLGIMMPENHPETRVRHAVSARHLRALGDSLSLDSSYRFYTDDWGIISHTVQSALTIEAARWIDLRARVRGYMQSSAEFYQDGYATPQRYVTSDRELSSFWDVGGGLKAAFYINRFVIDLKLDAVHYRFSEFSRLPERNAIIGGAGARVKW